MPTYETTAPDGTVLRIEGPEDAHDEAMRRMQEHWTSSQDTWANAGKQLGVGVAKGAIGIPGLPGDLAAALPRAADWAREQAVKYGIMSPESAEADKARETAKGMRDIPIPGSREIQHKVEEFTGPFREPQTRSQRYAQTVGEFLPIASVSGPGGVARRLGAGASAGVGSEFAGEKTQGTKWEPYARIAGAVAGGGLPQVAARALTPFPAAPELSKAVDTLRKEGVNDLTAGQTTGNRGLRWMESAAADVPGGSHAAHAMDEASREQFTGAALRRIGSNETRATPDAMSAAHDRLQQSFQDLSARNNLRYDRPFINDIMDVATKYNNVLNSQQKQIVHNVINDIASQPGGMSGVQYQTNRSLLSKQANAVKQSDPYVSGALKGIRDSMDSAMERSISPQDSAAWKQARQQWGNMKRLENAVATSGELITPQSLKTAASTGRRGEYVRGKGPYDELAQAGKMVMSPLPNSGSPARLHALALMGALGGGALGGTEGGLAGGLAGHIADIGGTALGARAIMNPKVQEYLANQKLAPVVTGGREAMRKRLARALLQTQPNRLPAKPEESRQ